MPRLKRNYFQNTRISFLVSVFGFVIRCVTQRPKLLNAPIRHIPQSKMKLVFMKNDNLGDFVILERVMRELNAVCGHRICALVMTNKPTNLHLAQVFTNGMKVKKLNKFETLKLVTNRKNNVFISTRSYPFSGSLFSFFTASIRFGYRNDGLEGFLTHVLPSSRKINQYSLYLKNMAQALHQIDQINENELYELTELVRDKFRNCEVDKSTVIHQLRDGTVTICPFGSSQAKMLSGDLIREIITVADKVKIIIPSREEFDQYYGELPVDGVEFIMGDFKFLSEFFQTKSICICSDSFLSHFASYWGNEVIVGYPSLNHGKEWAPPGAKIMVNS